MTNEEKAIDLLKGLYITYAVSSGPPGYLIRDEQMAEVGEFLSIADPEWSGVLSWHRK